MSEHSPGSGHGFPADPPGAAGWREMYPSRLLIDPVHSELEAGLTWVRDDLHHPGVKYPFDTIVNDEIRLAKGQWTSRVFTFPRFKGAEARIVNGYSYVASIPVNASSESSARQETFDERSSHYFDNWSQLYEGWLHRTRALIASTDAITIPVLDAGAEPWPDALAGAANVRSVRLLDAYEELCISLRRAWQYHFELLSLGYHAYSDFYTVAEKQWPQLDQASVAAMVRPADSMFVKSLSAVRSMSERLLGLPNAQLLVGLPWKDAQALLRETSAGKDFLQSMNDSGETPWHVASDGGLSHKSFTWSENPGELWDRIRLVDPQVSETLAPRSELNPSSLLAPLGDDERVHLLAALGRAREVAGFLEDHSYYIENWYHSVFWRKMRQVGATVARVSPLGEQDIFLFHRSELSDLLYTITHCWANGSTSQELAALPEVVARRTRLIAALNLWTPPRQLGRSNDGGRDPSFSMLFGVGATSAMPAPRQSDQRAEVTFGGAGVSAGRAVGSARVIASDSDLLAVQPGEILVAHAATASWVPALRRAAGIVSEFGGILSHAAILAREFAVPAVMGASGIVDMVSTGDVLEIDGTSGTVVVRAKRGDPLPSTGRGQETDSQFGGANGCADQVGQEHCDVIAAQRE